MNQLKTGDPCPCCGRPIKSRDPELLALLTQIAEQRRFPTAEEIHVLLEKKSEDG